MKCIKCGEDKSESEFYPSYIRKHIYICKHCGKKRSKAWREKNLEKSREYGRRYIYNHPEVNRACFRRWYKDNASKQYERRLAYVRADPQRHNAQCYAWRKYPDAQECEIEGCVELGERHHDDYSKPHEIRWLCRLHHKEYHKKLRKEKELELVVY